MPPKAKPPVRQSANDPGRGTRYGSDVAAFQDFLEFLGKDDQWFIALRADQQAEAWGYFNRVGTDREGWVSNRDAFTTRLNQIAQNTFMHPRAAYQSLAHIHAYMEEDREATERFRASGALETGGGGEITFAPSDEKLLEKYRTKIVPNAETIDLFDDFIPAVFTPEPEAIVEARVQKIAASLLGRRLNEAERARVIAMWRGGEKERFGKSESQRKGRGEVDELSNLANARLEERIGEIRGEDEAVSAVEALRQAKQDEEYRNLIRAAQESAKKVPAFAAETAAAESEVEVGGVIEGMDPKGRAGVELRDAMGGLMRALGGSGFGT